MTKIKLCGLRREQDIIYANELRPEYIGFVFAPKSKRYVNLKKAENLRRHLKSEITPVGVFVDEEINTVAALVQRGIIDVIQLHGKEDEDYIRRLREQVDIRIIKAFCVGNKTDVEAANRSTADYVLLDAGQGSGNAFDWSLIQNMERPYFLAGGLTAVNVGSAIECLHPFAVDASSCLETGGFKDKEKMAAFVEAVRKRG